MSHTYAIIRYVHIFSACIDDFADGLFWSNSRRNVSVTQPCSELHPSFRSGVNIERQCLHDGSWSSVDISSCTMFRNSYPVVVVYFTLNNNNNTDTVDATTIINNVSFFNHIFSMLGCIEVI